MSQALNQFTISVLRLYQIFLSPLKGPTCRFYPSCSHYGIESVKKYGFALGIAKTSKRLLKCHPFHPGGVDCP